MSVAEYTDALDPYQNLITACYAAMKQLKSIAAGRAQRECGLCGDNGHTVEECYEHNPVLLMAKLAVMEHTYKCFHCRRTFYSEQDAQDHFGTTASEIAYCLRPLAQKLGLEILEITE